MVDLRSTREPELDFALLIAHLTLLAMALNWGSLFLIACLLPRAGNRRNTFTALNNIHILLMFNK